MSSSEIVSKGLVTFSITIEGNKIPDSYGIISIKIERSVNRISSCTLLVEEQMAADSYFKVSASDNFVPGKKISIEVGYDCTNKEIFKGIVTKQSVRVDSELGPTIEVSCKDESIQMTAGRKSVSYAKSTDSDAITKIIGNYSTLTADVTSTSQTLPIIQQYYTTDWDFMLSRAEVNGMIITTIDGKVSVFAPDKSTASVLKLQYGDNLISFNADLNSISQLAKVTASAWDDKTQALITGDASNDSSGAGNITSKTLSDVSGLADFALQTTAAEDKDNLTNWAKAQMIKSEYSKITGTASFQGTGLVLPGTYLTVTDMGARFNGDYIVSGVQHEIRSGDWITTAELGISPQWFTESQSDISAPSASGLLPGVQGLFNATVKKAYDDPDDGFRVQVDLPLFDQSGEGLWARMVNNYSTDGAGIFFFPEEGDEVIVGFLNDDPRYPVILGSVYSKKLKPFSDLTPDDKNSKKAIVTKSKLQLEFNDEDKVITLVTPGKNTIVLDDKNKKITIKDQNGNSIETSDSGIEIKSSKAISIESDKSITLKGSDGVKIESSSGDVSMKGSNIKQEAEQELSLKGSTKASIEGGSECIVKGAMVKIN